MLPTNRLGLGRLRRFGPSPAARATFRYASLRARRGVHSKNRVRKVQGDAKNTSKIYGSITEYHCSFELNHQPKAAVLVWVRGHGGGPQAGGRSGHVNLRHGSFQRSSAVAADASLPSVIQFSDLAIERPWFLRDTAALGLRWTIEPGAWNCLSRRSQIVLVQESRGIKIILAQWPWPHGVQLIRFR